MLKLHAANGGGRARVVVNQAGPGGRRAHLADAGPGLHPLPRRAPALAGIVRRDPRVPEFIRRQMPLLTRHPGCAAAADIVALAKSLTE